jgi:hypothetical protein
LHEACKAAYTGVDRDGPREVLRQLPGAALLEMADHGLDTMCCGSGAECWFPASAARMRARRLAAAARTGAEQLVTVCPYCSQTFAAEEARYDFQVANDIDLVAGALGIRRDDMFKRYARWAGLERMLEDAEPRIARSPFKRYRIVAVLRAVFTGWPHRSVAGAMGAGKINPIRYCKMPPKSSHLADCRQTHPHAP